MLPHALIHSSSCIRWPWFQQTSCWINLVTLSLTAFKCQRLHAWQELQSLRNKGTVELENVSSNICSGHKMYANTNYTSRWNHRPSLKFPSTTLSTLEQKQEMLTVSLKPVFTMKVMHETGCGLTLKQFLQTFAVQVHSTIAMVSMSRRRELFTNSSSGNSQLTVCGFKSKGKRNRNRRLN